MRDRYVFERKDLSWSACGDFIFQNGDIVDTRKIKGLGFIEEVERRIKTSFNDWKLSPEEGANLHTYRGKLNNKQTWISISNSINYSLTFDGFLNASEFQVFVAPVSNTEVAVRLDFSDNIKNKLDEKLQTVRMIYNLDGEGPFIMR